MQGVGRTTLASRKGRRKKERKNKEEARKTALFLLQPLTDEKMDFVNKSIYDEGPEDQIISQIETNSIQLGSMQILQLVDGSMMK